MTITTALAIVDRVARDISAGDAELLALAARIRERMRSAIIEIGRDLIAAKAKLGHGSFGKWLADNFQMTERTAQNYMRAAECFGDQIRNPVSDLPPTAIYALSAPSVPADVRRDILQRIEAGKLAPKDAIGEANEAAQKVREAERNARETRRKAREAEKRAARRAKRVGGPETPDAAAKRRKAVERRRQQEEREERERQEKQQRRDDATARAVEIVVDALGDRSGEFVAALAQTDAWAFAKRLAEVLRERRS